jgi:hypothetical protein
MINFKERFSGLKQSGKKMRKKMRLFIFFAGMIAGSFFCMETACQSASSSSSSKTGLVLPEGTLKYEPQGIVTLQMEDGSSIRGIANSLRFSQSRGEFMTSYVKLKEDDKLPVSYLKTVKLEARKDGEHEYVHVHISDTEGDTYNTTYSNFHTVSFISADDNVRIKEKTNDLDFIYLSKIKSMNFNWEQKSSRKLNYAFIEYHDDQPALLVPREALLFEIGHVTNIGLYIDNKYAHLHFDENYGLPLNKIIGYEILTGEKANYHDIRYEVKILKKNGESDKAYVTGMVKILALLNTGVTEIGLGEIKRIIFTGNNLK